LPPQATTRGRTSIRGVAGRAVRAFVMKTNVTPPAPGHACAPLPTTNFFFVPPPSHARKGYACGSEAGPPIWSRHAHSLNRGAKETAETIEPESETSIRVTLEPPPNMDASINHPWKPFLPFAYSHDSTNFPLQNLYQQRPVPPTFPLPSLAALRRTSRKELPPVSLFFFADARVGVLL